MNNPFKLGEKVFIKIRGQQVEAMVNQVWNEEVQVRTSDKKLLWRTIKTVALTNREVSSPTAESPEAITASESTSSAKVEIEPEPFSPALNDDNLF